MQCRVPVSAPDEPVVDPFAVQGHAIVRQFLVAPQSLLSFALQTGQFASQPGLLQQLAVVCLTRRSPDARPFSCFISDCVIEPKWCSQLAPVMPRARPCVPVCFCRDLFCDARPGISMPRPNSSPFCTWPARSMRVTGRCCRPCSSSWRVSA